MEGPSHASWTDTLAQVHRIQGEGGVELRTLAGELYALSESLGANSHLLRALADPSRDGWPKREMVGRLFGGKVSAPAQQVLETAVSHRWVNERDLVDVLERAGADTVLAAAERDGNLDKVEEELFSFDQLVSHTNGLREALNDGRTPAASRTQLVVQLLEGKALPDTVWLAMRPVQNPRGRKYSAILWRILSAAAARRQAMTAVVTSAVELTAAERDRLAAGLAKTYGRPVFVNTKVDPSVLGGLRVEIGDELLDGSVARRLDDARRAMGAA